ncbi:hypothetical protein [Ferruginibacter sp. HRS2-29]|uniref:hypothetical protein n=1 Tax=Ferruginibacter sp. HRS2-29 TaxID=2487334 RepID=UPI0020CD52EE|nr:hypothetical protein [Ferruginibacter sp. HRS2-29]MCP9753196.1 hypothetical protein [Ferruginibacter sp. HRS2-29]
MERVQTLTNKLHEQLASKASVNELMLTVEMLQSELLHLQSAEPAQQPATPVSIHVATTVQRRPLLPPRPEAITISEPEPAPVAAPVPAIAPEPAPPAEEEKIVEVLQIDEAEVEAELEEIKRNAEERAKISAQNKPHLLFDPVEDIPTLTHQQSGENVPRQKELHESIAGENKTSLNDRLKEQKTELSETLQDTPIKDLKKGIGLNDRFLFIKELFRGDETMYERSIKTINGFSIFPEAEYWIKRELKLKLAWDDKNETVRQFDQLVRRRFA